MKPPAAPALAAAAAFLAILLAAGAASSGPDGRDPGAARSPGRVSAPKDSLLRAPLIPDPSATIDRTIREHLDRFATPEYHARKAERRAVQRNGYAGILHELLRLDPGAALLAWIRTRLQIEYSLPHNGITFRDDLGVSWPLPEDWTFPEDPWGD